MQQIQREATEDTNVAEMWHRLSSWLGSDNIKSHKPTRLAPARVIHAPPGNAWRTGGQRTRRHQEEGSHERREPAVALALAGAQVPAGAAGGQTNGWRQGCREPRRS